MTHMIRKPQVLLMRGKSDATNNRDVNDGTMTPGIPISKRLKAWPDYEVEAVTAAQISGATTSEIRQLVRRLVARRKTVMENVIGTIDSERVR